MADKEKLIVKDMKIREIPAKIKEVKPEKQEESRLEEELEEKEEEKFTEFVSQDRPSASFLRSAGIPQEIPEELEQPRNVVAERPATSREEFSRSYEPTQYTLTQRQTLSSSAAAAVPIFRPDVQSPMGRTGRQFGDRELARIRGEVEEASETQYAVEIEKGETKRKLPWE